MSNKKLNDLLVKAQQIRTEQIYKMARVYPFDDDYERGVLTGINRVVGLISRNV